MITFSIKCRFCGRDFECDGHCANSDMDLGEKFWTMTDDEITQYQKERGVWNAPKNKVCTCDFCKNRLVDSNGKQCNNHCEPDMKKVSFT